MLPGPVFNFELMATARRSRFYLIRAFYAAILFVILWGVHSAWTSETGGELPSKMVSWFAFSTFCGITIGQEILVLVLTPALVAGVIADEKQRKTLHYLMASRLSSAEIVLGKLLVRMLYVTVLLGVSLPVLSLLVLLGGVDPLLVLLSCGATLSTGWFLASLSIWVSTIARRVREAFFIAFGLECLWLFSPLILRNISIPAWPGFDQTAHWLAEWVGASSPIEVAYDLFYTVVFGRGARTPEVELDCLDDGVATRIWLGPGSPCIMAVAPHFSPPGFRWRHSGDSRALSHSQASNAARRGRARKYSAISRSRARASIACSMAIREFGLPSAIVPCFGKSSTPIARVGLPSLLDYC